MITKASSPSPWHRRSMAKAMIKRFGASNMPYKCTQLSDSFTWKCEDVENGVGHYIIAEYRNGRLKVIKEHRGT